MAYKNIIKRYVSGGTYFYEDEEGNLYIGDYDSYNVCDDFDSFGYDIKRSNIECDLEKAEEGIKKLLPEDIELIKYKYLESYSGYNYEIKITLGYKGLRYNYSDLYDNLNIENWITSVSDNIIKKVKDEYSIILPILNYNDNVTEAFIEECFLPVSDIEPNMEIKTYKYDNSSNFSDLHSTSYEVRVENEVFTENTFKPTNEKHIDLICEINNGINHLIAELGDYIDIELSFRYNVAVINITIKEEKHSESYYQDELDHDALLPF